MRFLILLFALTCLKSFSQNYNTELLSNVRFADDCANIWGYSDSSGREYAIIGRVTGTSVFDVTDGRKPVLLQHIPGVLSSWREIKSWKDRIYVVADRGADGVLIINMAQAPTNLTFTFWKPPIKVDDKILNISKTDFINRAHDLFIDEKGYCYLTGSNLHQGVVILDVNKNADIPEFVGIFNPNYTHDAFARNDTFWSADIIAGEFTVWDLKDKTKPKKLANQRTGNAFTHNIWLSDDGQYAFTTDERANAYVESYRVSDLGNITLLDRYRSRTTQIRNTIPHNTYYHRGNVITSYYTDGFTIVDANDPTHLVEVGSYDTYPAGEGDFHGCWGVYPYLPSGNILASDIEFGLFVVKPMYKKASYIKGLIKDSITGQAIANAIVKIEVDPFQQISSIADGTFKSGGPFTGNVQVTFSRSDYESKTMTLNLETGKVSNADVLLRPLKSIGLKLTVIDAVTKIGIVNAQIRCSRPGETIIINTNEEGKSENSIREGNWQFYAGTWGYRYKIIPTKSYIADQNLIIELERGYEDNFVFDYSWTANSSSPNIRGVWGRAEPRGSYIREKTINPELDIPHDIGDQCMVTGNGSTASTGDDVDGGFTRLVSPIIDLSLFQKPSLDFYAWTTSINTIDTIKANGSFKVYVWSDSDTLTLDSIPHNKSSWNEYQLPIDKSKLKSLSNIRVVFEASEPLSADPRNILEFAIDGFSIIEGNGTTAIDNSPNFSFIQAYPSPWQHQLNISVIPSGVDRKIHLVDYVGRLAYETVVLKNHSSLIIQAPLPVGIYFLRLMHKGVVEAVVKVVKVE